MVDANAMPPQPHTASTPSTSPTVTAPQCGACGLAIRDRWLLHVLDRPWHAHCLVCAECRRPQEESCFFRDGLIWCREHFVKRYSTRCAGCDQVIEKHEMVRRARDLLYHCRCFCCSVCKRALDTGEQLYIVDGNRFVCKEDFVQSRLFGAADPHILATQPMPPQIQSPVSDSEEECDEHSGDDHVDTATISTESNSGTEDPASAGKPADENQMSQKRRGPRTTIKAKQLDTLKSAFATTPKPTRHIREQLAAETGLNMRVIQVWFQNRRSKERRMKQMRFNGTFRTSRRQRQSNASATAPSSVPAREDVPMEPAEFIGMPMGMMSADPFYSTNGAPPNAGMFEPFDSAGGQLDGMVMPMEYGHPAVGTPNGPMSSPLMDPNNGMGNFCWRMPPPAAGPMPSMDALPVGR